MSGATQAERMLRGLALELIRAISDDLRESVERLEIAGSVRRGLATVGDIELVAVPAYYMVPVGLWGEEKGINLLDASVARLLALSGSGWDVRLDKNGRRAVGEKYKRLTFQGYALDLFSVTPPAQFGVIYTIRTGPAIYSHRLVSHPSVKLDDGSYGVMPFHMCVQEGRLFNHGKVVDTPTEEDFLRAIGQPWLEPWKRR